MLRLLFGLIALLPTTLRVAVVRTIFDRIWGLYVEQHVHGAQNIPSGPSLFVCNHLSNADGYTLYRALQPKEVWFMAGVKLQGTTMTRLGSEVVNTISIRPNSPDLEAFRRAVETLKAGRSVLIFPEGGRSRTGALIRAKRGVALIARRAGVPVVPVALTGTAHFLPINDSDMGGEKIHKARVDVRIGKPFMISELQLSPAEGEDPRQLLADAIMQKVCELLPVEYKGVYR